MLRFAFLLAPVVSLVALVGCSEKNPESCEIADNMSKPECGGPGGGSDGGDKCETAADCTSSPSYPICDTTRDGGTCVQCTAADKSQCIGTKPVCDLTTEACTACSVDEDCGTKGVCLPDGSCAAEASILHVTSTSIGGDCSAANPCPLLTAVNNNEAAKTVIRIGDAGTIVTQGLTFNKAVTLDAREATITRRNIGMPNDGPILTVSNGAKLTLLGGRLSGATGSNGDAIRCDQGTLSVRNTTMTGNNESAIDGTKCLVSVYAATISNNGSQTQPGIKIAEGSFSMSRSKITDNKGTGLDVASTATFSIVGNLFMSNGNMNSTTGGVSINTTGPGRFEFNTITNNIAKGTGTAGVSFDAESTVAATNNVIWKNTPLTTDAKQVGGGNPFAYCFIGPTAPTGVLDGGHNDVNDPLLTDGKPAATSPVKGKAQPTADITGDLAKDLDGKPRVVRSGAGADVGAYVVPE